MSQKKFGFRSFGLTLIAVLGLMAFMAVSAQANWLYLEGGVAHELTANEEVSASAHKEPVLLYEGNGGKLIELKCAEIKGEDLLLIPGSATEATATGKVTFSTCHTFANGVAQPSCDPTNQPLTAGGVAKVILHTDGLNYVLFSPPTGSEVFTEIKFSAENCALTSTNKVKGNLVAECGLLKGEETTLQTTGEFVRSNCGTHMTWHLLQQAPAELFPSDVLKFGGKVARLDGIAKVELAGTHKGLSWGGTV